MQPVATYHEKRFDGQRTFVLFPDRLSITGKQSLGGEFETQVLLATLIPIVNRSRARDPGFIAGIIMVICAGGLHQGGVVDLFSYWGGLVAVLGFGGALMSIVTARKVEWAQFMSTAGTIAVSVAHTGPEKDRFEPFVTAVLHRIQASVAKPPHE